MKVELLQKLKEGEVDEEIVGKYKASFSSKDIRENNFYSFWLPEVLSDKNQKYWLHFSADVASGSASVSPVVSRVDNYLDGETSSSQGPLEGDLVFQPIYQVKGVYFLTHFLNRIAFGKPVFFNKFLLAGLFSISLLAMVGLFFIVAVTFLKRPVQFWKTIRILVIIAGLGMILFFKPLPNFYFN